MSWGWDIIFTTDAVHPNSSLDDLQNLCDRATLKDAWLSACGFERSFCQMYASVHAGKVLYYFLVSWLYALYSFDYRWGLSHKHLQQRVAFFQQHWAFFLGGLPAWFRFLSLKTMLCKASWHRRLVVLSLCLRMDISTPLHANLEADRMSHAHFPGPRSGPVHQYGYRQSERHKA